MNILFTLDINYIEQLKKCLGSIIRFHVKEGWDIYIVTEDITEFRDFAYDAEHFNNNVRIHLIQADTQIFEAFPETIKYTRVVYYRIFAASVLPQNLDRVLYLDPDTIVINPLDEFYYMDLRDSYYAACSHTKGFLTEINRVRLGIKKEVSYINSGVLLMNLALLRKEQTLKSVYDYVRKRGKYFVLPDQDIITVLYGDKVTLVDTYKYNLSDRLIVKNNLNPANEYIDLEWVKKNAIIIHYYGDNKPWRARYIGMLDVFYNEVEALDNNSGKTI